MVILSYPTGFSLRVQLQSKKTLYVPQFIEQSTVYNYQQVFMYPSTQVLNFEKMDFSIFMF